MDDTNDFDGDYKVIEQCLQQTQVSSGERIWEEREGRGEEREGRGGGWSGGSQGEIFLEITGSNFGEKPAELCRWQMG